MSRNFGKYIVEGIIGRGSAGMVYRAKDPMLERYVAIKTINRGEQFERARVEFEREARLLASLRHQNICTLLEADLDALEPYLVLDYIDGKPLSAIINEYGVVAPELLLMILAQVGAALDYAHAQGIIHRDVKPDNILLDRTENAYLVDFSLAVLYRDVEHEQLGAGSPAYMAPEVLRGETPDRRSDVFSLAVVAFEALLGQPPFSGKDAAIVVRNICSAEPKLPSAITDGFGETLDFVFSRALSKERRQRYSTAGLFVEALVNALATEQDTELSLGKRARAEEQAEDKTDPQMQAERLRSPEEGRRHSEDVASSMRHKDAAAKSVFRSSPTTTKPSIDVQDLRLRAQGLSSSQIFIGLSAIAFGVVLVFVAILFVGNSSPSGSMMQRSSSSLAYQVRVFLGLLPPPEEAVPAALTDQELVGFLRGGRLSESTALKMIGEISVRDRSVAIEGIKIALTHPRYLVRIEALKILERWADATTVTLVGNMLRDKDLLVRVQAVRTLAAIRTAAVRPLLERAVHDSSPEVSSAAENALQVVD